MNVGELSHKIDLYKEEMRTINSSRLLESHKPREQRDDHKLADLHHQYLKVKSSLNSLVKQQKVAQAKADRSASSFGIRVVTNSSKRSLN